MQQNAKEQPSRLQTLCVRENEETELDLVELLFFFGKHLWKIILCFIVGALIAFAYTRAKTVPQYKATASVYVVPASDDETDVAGLVSGLSGDKSMLLDVMDAIKKLQNPPSDASLIADYKELLLSRPLLQDVIQSLSLNMNYTALESMITISDTKDTHVVKVTVTGTEAQQVADIANELVSQGAVYFQNYVELDPPEVIEEAVAPVQAFNLSRSKELKNTAVGGLVGAVLCCGVLLALFLMQDAFVTADDIARHYGVQPLATIPEATRKQTRL